MSIYVEKQASIYGQGYGVRFRPCEGGDLCRIILLNEDGNEEGEGVLLNWDVAKALGKQIVELAGERA